MTDRATPFRLERPTVATTAKGQRVSAVLDGAEVWFSSDGFDAAQEGGNAFLCVALLAAMAEGRDLDMLEMPPVSGTLLDALPTLQAIWTAWNPFLSRIEVRAHRADPMPRGQGEGLFFSGGIDAVHSALEGTPGQSLVFISGFDQLMDESSLVATTNRLSRLAHSLGSPLVMVESNWIEWRRGRRLSASLVHGGCLAGVAHLLGFGRMTISSSNSYNRLTPWGTHRLADPWWSTDRTEIRHWGNHCTRGEKVTRVARATALHGDLWVCHARPVGNCGRCSKCARTRLAFHLVGSALPVDGVSDDPVTAYVPHLRRGSEHIFAEEMIALARARGDDHAVRVLTRGAARLRRRHLLRDLRNVLFPRSAGRRMATTDLQPWGYGPAPRSL